MEWFDRKPNCSSKVTDWDKKKAMWSIGQTSESPFNPQFNQVPNDFINKHSWYLTHDTICKDLTIEAVWAVDGRRHPGWEPKRVGAA